MASSGKALSGLSAPGLVLVVKVISIPCGFAGDGGHRTTWQMVEDRLTVLLFYHFGHTRSEHAIVRETGVMAPL